MPKVTVFNTGSEAISLRVNNGNSSPIAGANNGQPSFNNWDFNNNPMPNTFGSGANFLSFTNSSPEPKSFSVDIPGNIQIRSLQLYIFFNFENVSWALLNDGQLLQISNV